MAMVHKPPKNIYWEPLSRNNNSNYYIWQRGHSLRNIHKNWKNYNSKRSPTHPSSYCLGDLHQLHGFARQNPLLHRPHQQAYLSDAPRLNRGNVTSWSPDWGSSLLASTSIEWIEKESHIGSNSDTGPSFSISLSRITILISSARSGSTSFTPSSPSSFSPGLRMHNWSL